VEGERKDLVMAAETQLTIDDIKGVVGAMVIDSIIKDKRIAELSAENEQLKKELEHGSRGLSSVDGARNRNDLSLTENVRTMAGN
jgi:hypothetical protein